MTREAQLETEPDKMQLFGSLLREVFEDESDLRCTTENVKSMSGGQLRQQIKDAHERGIKFSLRPEAFFNAELPYEFSGEPGELDGVDIYPVVNCIVRDDEKYLFGQEYLLIPKEGDTLYIQVVRFSKTPLPPSTPGRLTVDVNREML